MIVQRLQHPGADFLAVKPRMTDERANGDELAKNEHDGQDDVDDETQRLTGTQTDDAEKSHAGESGADGQRTFQSSFQQRRHIAFVSFHFEELGRLSADPQRSAQSGPAENQQNHVEEYEEISRRLPAAFPRSRSRRLDLVRRLTSPRLTQETPVMMMHRWRETTRGWGRWGGGANVVVVIVDDVVVVVVIVVVVDGLDFLAEVHRVIGVERIHYEEIEIVMG